LGVTVVVVWTSFQSKLFEFDWKYFEDGLLMIVFQRLSVLDLKTTMQDKSNALSLGNPPHTKQNAWIQMLGNKKNRHLCLCS